MSLSSQNVSVCYATIIFVSNFEYFFASIFSHGKMVNFVYKTDKSVLVFEEVISRIDLGEGNPITHDSIIILDY